MKIVISVICIVGYYIAIAALPLQISMQHDFLIAVVYVFIPIIGIPLAIHGLSIYQKSRKGLESMRAKLVADGFCISHELHDFFIDTTSKRVCFYQAFPNGDVKHWVLNFTDVLGTSVVKDGETVLKTSNGSVVGRALLGGVIMGGLGAVIGGVTAASSSSFKVKDLMLEIVLNCADHPIHRIHFLNFANQTEDSASFKESLKKLEFVQVLCELMIMNENIPSANCSVDLKDTVRMIKLKAQRAMSAA